MELKGRFNFNDLNTLGIMAMTDNLSPEDSVRLSAYRKRWNYYDGYHWEDIPPQDKPEVTENYCRKFVDKFISAEFGKGFANKFDKDLKGKNVDSKRDITEYVDYVWKYNKRDILTTELGQSKNITGDGWVKVTYTRPENLVDPFGEYPKGKINLQVLPSSIVFPKYNSHNKDILEKLTIAYPIEVEETGVITKRKKVKTVVYKQIWTAKTFEIWEGQNRIVSTINKYGVIPITQIKNFPVVGRNEGLSDLDDIIPLNAELNMKLSDISEIIDYHSAPVTVVFGAKVSGLTKGANKIWGGLPKDAKVKNLELDSDLGASMNYAKDIRTAIHEVGGIPQGALGSNQHISNTSGVALQYVNMPIIERVAVKRNSSKIGLEHINKLIIHISLVEKLITVPEGVDKVDLFANEVTFPDFLPKDELIELQKIETEMRLGLENREGAMKRTGKTNIDIKLAEIDKDREKYPEIYNLLDKDKQLNSGMTNGETPIEQLRKESKGENKK